MSSTPTINGTSGNPSSHNTPVGNSSGGSRQLKMSTGKVADGLRKQAGSPVDTSQKKPSTQKAWTAHINPITQRHSNPSPANGAVSASKPTPTPKNMTAATQESNTPEKHANDRLLFLLANFTGQVSSVTLKNGEQFLGVFSGATLEPNESRYVLKMVKRINTVNDSQTNGVNDTKEEYVGTGDDHVMTFETKDVVDLAVNGVVTMKTQSKGQNGVSSSFRTDADISGNLASRERTLQPWVPDDDGSALTPSLDEGTGASWDQFAANAKLFGDKSDYHEELYTTSIDRSHPEYRIRAAKAERIQREIEGSQAQSAHVAEERGQAFADDSGLNEEDKYSGVQRDYTPLSSGQPNRYTPPARRAPTGQPTVPGAPVDPAIISSQLSRPGAPPVKLPKSPSAAETVQKQADIKPTTADPATTNTTSTAKAPTPTPDAKTQTQVKSTTDAAPKSNNITKLSAAAAGPVMGPKTGKADNATANVESELLDSFKQFTANERLKVREGLENRRNAARQDRAVRLNELKKFSQNFKLHTPVPKDLVPILAKDETKQHEIVEKALKNLKELKTTPTKPAATAATATPAPVDPKQQRPIAPRFDGGHSSPNTQVDRQNVQGPRRTQPHFPHASMRNPPAAQMPNMNATPPRSGPGLLGQRLAITQQQHKAGAAALSIPPPMPIQDMRVPPTGPSASSSGVQTPSSTVSTRFNVKASEFRPNPAANTFMPGTNPSTGSSPKTEAASRPEPVRKTTKFWADGKKPEHSSDRPKLSDIFNPVKRMLKEVQAEGKVQELSGNGGIPQAFRTGPVWDNIPEANKERSYEDMFEKPVTGPSASAPQANMSNGPMPHQHQLPPHLQQGAPNMPQAQTPHHTPRNPNAQPFYVAGAPPHFDGHPMQHSNSQQHVHPSPRPAMPYMVYGPQGPQASAMYPGQPMPVYGASPNMNTIPMRPAGAPQYVNPQNPGMGGSMMVPQGSQGPFMGVPGNAQIPMYSPNPGHPYQPHMNGPVPAPHGSGFPSPRPPVAQMMTHQGSQQGHQNQPVYFMQPGGQGPAFVTQMPPGSMTPMRSYAQMHHPQFGTSPHQPHYYPAQPPRGTPGMNYSQPMMMTHSMPPQGGSPAGPPPPHTSGNGEEVK